MKRPTFVPRQSMGTSLVFILFFTTSPLVAAPPVVLTSLSTEQLTTLLEELDAEEIRTIDSTDRQTLTTATIGRQRFSILYDTAADNLQLFLTFENRSEITRDMLDRANTWNRDRRYSEVYLDENDHWIIETDIDLSTGISEENLLTTIERFLEATEAFDHLLNEL